MMIRITMAIQRVLATKVQTLVLMMAKIMKGETKKIMLVLVIIVTQLYKKWYTRIS